jgi:CxxC motif-containing protein (DUF1111 family)
MTVWHGMERKARDNPAGAGARRATNLATKRTPGRARSALVLLTVLTATTTTGEELGDPHLSVVPRTPDEVARIAVVTAPPVDFRSPEPFEGRPGGAASVRATDTVDAFSLPSGNMAFDRQMDFRMGNGLFRKLWVAAPASTLASDGLGPFYNARGCQNCHLKDGRGHPPAGPDEPAVSMFLRLSVPASNGGADAPAIEGYLAALPEPTYGWQLQDVAAPGLTPEGRMVITWTERPVALADGTVISLRAPAYSVADLAQGPLAPDVMLSPRVAPQMIGLGLLEAIPAAEILARVDEDDADGDGISGRANLVWSPEYDRPMLGRFGHKAGSATIREQSAGAFAADMGLSSVLHPDPWGDCTPTQAICRASPHGQEPGIRDGLEVDGESLDLVTFYSRNLAVPDRRTPHDPRVLHGKQVFHDIGCAACHTPKHVTARLSDQPEQSFQLIWPYTDLLLHDVGPGLADNRPEARATGVEWRTAPLWGIGLTEQVTGTASFLHDGRARTLLEAVLWHGGEAQAARDAVVALPATDRAALLAFLESL